MQLVIISGRSGSGKSTVLHVLEDAGFTCIDNLPASLLPNLAKHSQKAANKRYAISIDARNTYEDLKQLPFIILDKPINDIQHQVIFLDASNDILLQRFSETRRKHPLTDQTTDLRQAINQEKELLKPILDVANIVLDTSDMKYHDLRDVIKRRFMAIKAGNTAVMFQSFGFKYGIPKDADLVFDARCLPNPHWKTHLRQLTGQDDAVKQFLNTQTQVEEMFQDITQFLSKWLPRYEENNRSYITIAIGCTGGQHRSVYLCERLASYFEKNSCHIQRRHRELKNHD
ncbi:RNase adaptor protein RapZ [Candidatus Endobugula sertula]|uniref:RNase adaptor protein RapZ n=1 Tax=Candidatus Endobugula sertula TaxID=62101 RepID=A0A1D2QQP0_9GAMM|nr:RNase adaptor protein RapZ [Candidatus Endobugula sertula]